MTIGNSPRRESGRESGSGGDRGAGRADGDAGGDAHWERLLILLEPQHDRALRTARRLAGGADDGDDLYQEAVLRAHQALPALRDDDRFPSWFFTVLLSVHRNRTRRSFWRRFLPREEAPAGADPPGEDGRAWEEDRARAARVSRALAALPAEQREAVVLFELEGMSVEEVAALQRASPSAVKSRLARGRARLRRTYERWGIGRAHGRAEGRTRAAGRSPALASVPRREGEAR